MAQVRGQRAEANTQRGLRKGVDPDCHVGLLSPAGPSRAMTYNPAAMRILLLSMPDSFEHTPALTVRMPNGALASLAGNVDPHHDVAIADLVLRQSSVRSTVETLVHDF